MSDNKLKKLFLTYILCSKELQLYEQNGFYPDMSISHDEVLNIATCSNMIRMNIEKDLTSHLESLICKAGDKPNNNVIDEVVLFSDMVAKQSSNVNEIEKYLEDNLQKFIKKLKKINAY